jgi:lariat debranching enzyme
MIEDDDLEDVSSMKPEAAQPTASTSQSAAKVPWNPDEITLDDEEENVDAPPPPPPPPSITRFLALDKCLPNREYLEVISHISESHLS